MVPEGWTIRSPLELFDLFNGYAFKSTDSKEVGVRWLKIANVGIGEIKWDANSYLPKNFGEKYEKFILGKGDVVVALTRPTLGRQLKVARLTCDSDKALLNQRVAKVICKEGHHAGYIYQTLRSDAFAHAVNVSLLGTDPPNLSVKVLNSFTVMTPPFFEQRKISKILSTWDQAIATTEQLLANSERQKKALMQQLLTGKQRLPGFDQRWDHYKLSDVAKIIISPVDKKSNSGEQPVLLCNYTDVYYNNRIVKKMAFMSATAKDAEIKKYTLQEDDVVITKDSETPGDIAIPALVAEDLKGVVCGYHLAIIRPDNKKSIGAFIHYLLSMPRSRYYFFTLATGAIRFGLSVGAIHGAELRLPPVAEQRAVAQVLASCDDAIEALRVQLRCFKAEKSALMQQLLTGKRRVQPEEAA